MYSFKRIVNGGWRGGGGWSNSRFIENSPVEVSSDFMPARE